MFCPKKSGAHRIACIALYQALLSHSARIQLPAERLRGPISPIKHLIRKNFRQHRHVTSPKLITTALKIGYEAEELLHHAAEGDEAAYSKVLSLLQETQAQGDADRARRALNPPQLEQPRPRKPKPWLGAQRVLESRPRPESELSGRRQVPKFNSTTSVPFLCFKKPQSPFLTRIIRDQKYEMQQLTTYMENIEKDLVVAAQEDEWDRLVGDVARGELTFVRQLQILKKEAEQKRSVMIEKKSEIVNQMINIADQEKKLQEQEQGMRKLQIGERHHESAGGMEG